MNNPLKVELRRGLRKRRGELSEARRQEASAALLHLQLPYHFVLSFASLPAEIDLSLLNLSLAKQERLLLPRIEGNELIAYHVTDLKDLIPNAFKILEPDPRICNPAKHIDVILVPGLGFDQNNQRIGYGKGFYDRLLTRFPNIPHIGIGFKEQLADSIPCESHDVALTSVYLI